MCNILITAGITGIQPFPEVVLCTCTARAHLMAIEKSLYSKHNLRKYTFDHLESFRGSFELLLYEGNSDIRTFLILFNKRENSWVLIVGKRHFYSLKPVEKGTVFFCDSLGWTYPQHVISFFQDMFDHIFRSPKVQWKTFKQTQRLDIVRFRRQEESHSCGNVPFTYYFTFA